MNQQGENTGTQQQVFSICYLLIERHLDCATQKGISEQKKCRDRAYDQ